MLLKAFSTGERVRKPIKENEESISAVLTGKGFSDYRHIALTRLYCIVEFKHMVNIHTVQKVKGLNQILGYKTVEINMPSFLLF